MRDEQELTLLRMQPTLSGRRSLVFAGLLCVHQASVALLAHAVSHLFEKMDLEKTAFVPAALGSYIH